MLVRIPIKQLRTGMYIHEFCGSWYDHPFWRNTFLLDKAEDLQEILSTGIKEVWIDTGKGLGVEGGKAETSVASEVDDTLARAGPTGMSRAMSTLPGKPCVPSRFAPNPEKPSPRCSRKRAWAKP